MTRIQGLSNILAPLLFAFISVVLTTIVDALLKKTFVCTKQSFLVSHIISQRDHVFSSGHGAALSVESRHAERKDLLWKTATDTSLGVRTANSLACTLIPTPEGASMRPGFPGHRTESTRRSRRRGRRGRTADQNSVSQTCSQVREQP